MIARSAAIALRTEALCARPIIGTANAISRTTSPITTSISISVNARRRILRCNEDVIFSSEETIRTGVNQHEGILAAGFVGNARVHQVGPPDCGGGGFSHA